MSNKTTKVALQSALPSKKEEETRILNWDKASKILDLNRTESLRLVNEGKLLLSETKKIGLDDKCFPKSSATLHIPVEKLKSLPIGAVFTSKSGQATATVRYIHDTLYIVANCDSLQQLVYEYQQQIHKASDTNQTHQEESKRTTRFPYRILFGCSILLLGYWILMKINMFLKALQ